MILNLYIRNFVLIREFEITFNSGMNVITGVTGGGKSLILKALDFLLGARSSSEIIGTYGDNAEVSGVFTPGPAVRGLVISESGIDISEDDNLILRRVYREDKNNLCYLNGRPVNVSFLRNIGNLMVDYLAQNHQLQLQKTEKQLELFDTYAGTSNLLDDYRAVYYELKEKERIQKELLQNRDEWEKKAELLKHTLNELTAAGLSPGEDEKLKQDIAVFEHLSSILNTFRSAETALYEGESSAYDIIYSVSRVIDKLESVPEELREIASGAEAVNEGISDLVSAMRSYADSADFGEQSLEDLQERFYLIQDLKHKHGKTLEELITYMEELPEELEECSGILSKSGNISSEIERLEEKTVAVGKKLENKRKKALSFFEQDLCGNLEHLGMEKCVFRTGLSVKPFKPANAGPAGFSSVEFLFSANPGIEARPLRDIASGGELSRIMLAIQSVLRNGENQPVLVFDEIDSEIGGRLGNVIGDMMKGITRTRQILCITHLPQLACFGDSHFKIEKNIDRGSTEVNVKLLDEESRIRELAQMLGGDACEAETTLNEVKHMLEKVRNGTY